MEILTAQQVHAKVRELATALKLDGPRFYSGGFYPHAETQYPSGGELGGFRLSFQCDWKKSKVQVRPGYNFSENRRGMLCQLDLTNTVDELVQIWKDKVVSAAKRDKKLSEDRDKYNAEKWAREKKERLEWAKLLKDAGFKSVLVNEKRDYEDSTYRVTLRGGHELTISSSSKEIHLDRFSPHAKQTDGLNVLLLALESFIEKEVK